MPFLVTYVQEDIDRLVTFGPFDTLHAAATFAWGARAAAVRHWNEKFGAGCSAGAKSVDEIASSRIAEVFFDNRASDECYFRIDEPIAPDAFDPATLDGQVMS